MGEDRLTNRQFTAIALVIIMCGIAIIGHDYFLAKKSKAYEEMSILLSQEPGAVEPVEDGDDTSRIINNTTGNSANDPSGKVKRIEYTYNYIGRLKIPSINLNRGFVKYGTYGNNVNQNIAIMRGSKYPDVKESNFILAAHNGSGWNAFFTNIDKLKLGSMAYVTYKGKEYSYILKRVYSDPKKDGKVTIQKNNNKKLLTLVTCKRPDYKKYYLVLVFELVEEKDI